VIPFPNSLAACTILTIAITRYGPELGSHPIRSNIPIRVGTNLLPGILAQACALLENAGLSPLVMFNCSNANLTAAGIEGQSHIRPGGFPRATSSYDPQLFLHLFERHVFFALGRPRGPHITATPFHTQELPSPGIGVVAGLNSTSAS
jgi:hypothetical protein